MPKRTLKKLLKQVAKPAFKKELQSIKAIAEAYHQLATSYKGELKDNESSCEGILFSKDRAMQLHALLSSYFDYVKNHTRLYILYTTSSERHFQSYETLKKIFAGKDVVFIKEQAFKQDLEALLESINAAKLFFMTDDGLFIDRFDMNEIISFNPMAIMPSLTHGLDLTYCYIQNYHHELPPFIEEKELPEGMKCWHWQQASPLTDWGYPMSLDMSFYNKKEIQTLIKNIVYKAPNSLESALHSNYSALFLKRKGVCYDKAKYVNIVCNIVNTEHKNRNTQLHSIEELLVKWEEGNRIAYEMFLHKTCAEAEISAFSFVKR